MLTRVSCFPGSSAPPLPPLHLPPPTHTQVKAEAQARLPVQPSEDDPACVRIAMRLPDGPRLLRRFSKHDTVQVCVGGGGMGENPLIITLHTGLSYWATRLGYDQLSTGLSYWATRLPDWAIKGSFYDACHSFISLYG